MKQEELLLEAMGCIREEYQMEATHYQPKTRRFHKRGLLIAAAVAAALSITVMAGIAAHHRNSVELMESGPLSGGYHPVTLTEDSADVIERLSVDYNLSAEDQGTTVTLDSVMGMHTADFSIVYLTFTILPPEGTELPEDLQPWGFHELTAQLTDQDFPGVESSQTALRNEDGSIGVMFQFFYRRDVDGVGLNLHLSGFGDISKESAHALFDGTRMIELPGTWDFAIDELRLGTARVLSVDPELFLGTSLSVRSTALSEFGGTLTFSSDTEAWLGVLMKLHLEELQQIAPDVSWEDMTYADFDALYAAGGLSVEQFKEIDAVLNGFNTDDGMVELIYPDGRRYAARSMIYGQETGMLDRFVFEAPQDVSKASALSVGGIEIPLK